MPAWFLQFCRNINLLNVSDSAWKFLIGLICSQLLLSVTVFVCALACLGFGLEHAYGYSEINCGNALPIWTGLITVITAMFGLFASRTLHVRWPTYLYFCALLLSVCISAALIVDGTRMACRWKKEADSAPHVWTVQSFPTAIPTPWNPINFVIVDSVLVALVVMNEFVLLMKLAVLMFYWVPKREDITERSSS